MNKNVIILFFILFVCLIGCSDDDFDNTQEFTVYSHLDSGKPTLLNRIVDLSSYIDLDINISDLSVATAEYDWEGDDFLITPIKEGVTIVTVKEKNVLKYRIKIVVEYEGAGNWNINDSKITVQSDDDIKETIEQDMLERSLFYNQKEGLFYNNLFFENKHGRLISIMNDLDIKDRYTTYKFINETQDYEFIVKLSEERYLYKFTLHYKSDVGVKPQHKIGTYYIDRTKEYQEKYPDKNILEVKEEQSVECYYND
jgi:hypothetical protein